ncbi:MAG: hypothetical protein ACO1OQ_12865 [Rufibacter sp.]
MPLIVTLPYGGISVLRLGFVSAFDRALKTLNDWRNGVKATHCPKATLSPDALTSYGILHFAGIGISLRIKF